MRRLLPVLVAAACAPFHAGPLPGAPAADAYVDVERTHLRYRDAGEGPTVVFLHGLGATLETWDRVTPALHPGHRTIALDLKGFGWSSRPAGDYSPRAQARLVLAFLDEVGVENFSVVAHSWGSAVALNLAQLQPQRVQRVALLEPWVYDEQVPGFVRWSRRPAVGAALASLYDRSELEMRLEQAYADPDVVGQPLVDDVDARLRRPGARAATAAIYRDFRPPKIRDGAYAEITAPALIVSCREDALTPPRPLRRLADELPNATFASMEGCGHFPMHERLHATNRLLADFLAEGPTQ